MNTQRMTIALLAAATAAAITTPAAEAACQITKTPWGLQVTDCNLSEFYKNRYDVPLDIRPNRPILRMPNLTASDVDGTLVGSNAVTISVEIENTGTLNVSSAFEVSVLGSVSSPTGGVGIPFIPFPPISIPGLPAGSTAARTVGTVALPNRTQDWDVCAIATVDPALMGGPAWGNIFETNELDNTKDRCCRVYGPKPDTSRRSC